MYAVYMTSDQYTVSTLVIQKPENLTVVNDHGNFVQISADLAIVVNTPELGQDLASNLNALLQLHETELRAVSVRQGVELSDRLQALKRAFEVA